MDKILLQQRVLERLQADLLQAEQAARVAHETATHEENIAENKYDTLGLEAAYLASGQARRVADIAQALSVWRQLRPRAFDPADGIQLGALVCLADDADRQQVFFLGPDGASMKLSGEDGNVQVISAQAPLGQAMRGKAPGDELSIKLGSSQQTFAVLWVE
jgi:transcription elongation GreA/GreB family factor